jgi:hypothetical protein
MIVALICADDLYLGELTRVLEAMNWQRVTVSKFKLGGR